MFALQFDMAYSDAELNHLIKSLEQIPTSIRNRAVVGAIRAALKPAVKTARSLAPKRYGQLKKSLGISLIKYPATGMIYARLGPRRGFKTQIKGEYVNPTQYAHLVEYGFKQHRITAGKNAKAMMIPEMSSKGKLEGVAFRKTADNKGFAGTGFLRKTYFQHRNSAISIFATEIVKRLDAEAAKAAAKAPRSKAA